MKIMNVHQAKTQLSRLLEAVESGEDVVIARAGTPVARLVLVDPHERLPGRLRGCITVSDDFDAPLPHGLARPFGVEKDGSDPE